MLENGQRIRFLENTRNAPWRKGQFATIERKLASPPGSTDYIYLVRLDSGDISWCTGSEIEAWHQLSLFMS